MEDKKLMKLFGNKLKRLRNKRKLTQEELSFNSGLDRSHLAQIELGLKNISLITLYKLALGLNMEISEFFKEIDKKMLQEIEENNKES
jgi:transcriptional regulator with XRE-family HTH domain